MEEAQEKQDEAIKSLGEAIKKEEDVREVFEKNFAVFQESIKTSIRNFKLLVGILGTIFGILTPYVTLVIKDVLGK